MLSYGESEFSATVGPLAIDGLMTVCTAALIATAPHARAARESRRAEKVERKARREFGAAIRESQEKVSAAVIARVESMEKVESERVEPAETVAVRELVKPRESRPLTLVTTHSRAEQAQAVREMFGDWAGRIVTGPEVFAATGIRGSESIEKIKDVLYPDAERTRKRAAAAAARAAVKAGMREEVSA